MSTELPTDSQCDMTSPVTGPSRSVAAADARDERHATRSVCVGSVEGRAGGDVV
ncbi:hypothetical protein [Terrabacter sp. 2RAF25]|uniref:hypothetical protein n=1 Tax=Terrabacter sp. 2RAF25 TaxID=3232998 RepID=UPI003F9D69D3